MSEVFDFKQFIEAGKGKMTEEEIRPIAENYVEEFCHDIHGGYEDGDLVCAGIGTALIVARKLEKQNKELQKQISILLSCKDCPDNKGGYICEKEYNDKCLTQKIQYIKELQEENEQLKKEKYQLENLFKEAIRMYGIIFQGKEVDGNWYDVELVPFIPCLNAKDEFRIKPNTQLAELEKQVAEAKEIIKKYLAIGVGGKITQNYLDVTKEAERFLKDYDIDNAIQQANKGLDFDKIADKMEQDLKDIEEE